EEGLRLLQRHGARASGHQGHAALRGEGARPCLVAKQSQVLDRRADERNSIFGASLREVGSLAEKTVTRMDRIAATFPGDRDDAGDVEIGGRTGGVQCHGLIGMQHVRRFGVIVCIDCDAYGTEVAHRADEPEGDLTSIRYKDLLEHQAWSLSSRRNTLPAPVAGSASMK